MRHILRKLRRERAGFTLIELLIVIAITGLLAMAAVPNFLQALRSHAFNVQMAEVVTLAGEARTQALASEIDANKKIPPGGYGASFVKDGNVTLFVDNWNETESALVNMSYADADIAIRVRPDGLYTAGKDAVLGEVDFTHNKFVKITAIRGVVSTAAVGGCAVGATAKVNSATAIFQPPYGETTVLGVGFGPFSILEVEFKLSTDGSTRTLRLYRSTGAVEVLKTGFTGSICN